MSIYLFFCTGSGSVHDILQKRKKNVFCPSRKTPEKENKFEKNKTKGNV